MQNTDAFEDDGSSSSSVEASVMDGGEGDDIAKWGILVNWETRRNRMISTERGCFRKGATQSL